MTCITIKGTTIEINVECRLAIIATDRYEHAVITQTSQQKIAIALKLRTFPMSQPLFLHFSFVYIQIADETLPDYVIHVQ